MPFGVTIWQCTLKYIKLFWKIFLKRIITHSIIFIASIEKFEFHDE